MRRIRPLVSTAERRKQGNIPTNSEYRITRADTGAIVWISRRAQFMSDADGAPVRMIGTVQDVTERKQAENQQRVLHEELGHRLKNTLSLVQAIASQTLRKVADRDAVEAFEERITALSSAHDILLLQSWSAADMRAVMVGVLGKQADLSRIVVSGPDIAMGPKAALSLSLLLHELATNAVKYGALSVSSGRIKISWRVDRDDLVLGWQELDGPPVFPPAPRKGLGSRLIDFGLAGTGQVNKHYNPLGFTAEFRAPLNQMQEAAVH